jgi:EmrB/QacA subfamily drug resistance transporter
VSVDRRWLVLIVLALAQLMVVLDGTIVNIALPSAQVALHFSNGDRQWVVTAYALGFGSLLLVGGRLADMFGRRRLFLIGLVGFAFASALGGRADDLATLLGARAVQGVFAAMLAPALLALLTTTFRESKERSKAFGIFGAVAGAGAALGLLLGGILTEYLSWRWCLYVNLIFAVVTFMGGYALLERDDLPNSARVDWPGTISVTAGLFLTVFGFAHAESAGWSNSLTVVYLCAGVVLISAFLITELRVAQPLLPPRVLTDRNRAGAYTATFMVGVGMFGVFLFLTYYMQTILQLSAIRTGLAFLPMSAAIVAASSLGSTLLTPRVSPKIMIPIGMTIAAGGMLMFTRIAVGGSYLHHVLPASLVFGIGLGTIFGFASNTATRNVRPEDAGVASAMVNVAQQVGAAIGTALLNTLAAGATRTYLHGHPGNGPLVRAEAAVHGYVVGFWVAAFIFGAGAVLTAVLLRPGVLTGPPAEAPTELTKFSARGSGPPAAA